MSPELTAAIDALVARALARHTPLEWPRQATDSPRALLVYATEALFAYYLGVDGRVYVLDMDRFMGTLDPVTDRATIDKVRAAAIAQHPELAGL